MKRKIMPDYLLHFMPKWMFIVILMIGMLLCLNGCSSKKEDTINQSEAPDTLINSNTSETITHPSASQSTSEENSEENSEEAVESDTEPVKKPAGEEISKEYGDFVEIKNLVISSEDEKHAVITLAGPHSSPEWKAALGWYGYTQRTEMPTLEMAEKGFPDGFKGTLDKSIFYYLYFLQHEPRLAKDMEYFADKSALKLHTDFYYDDIYSSRISEYPEMKPYVDELIDDEYLYFSYMYEDGTFAVNNSWYTQFFYNVEGKFHDITLEVGNISDYQEYFYQTAEGIDVTISIGPERTFLFAKLDGAFFALHTQWCRRVDEDIDAAARDMMLYIDRIHFDKISSMAVPEPEESTDTADFSAGDKAARECYALVLKNLLYNGVLPSGEDGYRSNMGLTSTTEFALADVDFDGREELVLTCDGSDYAAFTGYVLDYNPHLQQIHIQQSGYHTKQFLENGVIKAMWSHNQTAGEMWPFTIFEYDPVSDTYEQVGQVYATDKSILDANKAPEKYPSEIDVSNTGTVYHILSPALTEVAVLDKKDFDAWIEDHQADAEERELTYWPLTQENIHALLAFSK